MTANPIVIENLDIEFIIVRAKLFGRRVPWFPMRIQVILDHLTLVDEDLLTILGVLIILSEWVRLRKPVHVQKFRTTPLPMYIGYL